MTAGPGARWRADAPILLAAAAVGIATAASASSRMGGIATLNGSYDAFFHHASIAFIRDRGDASVMTALEPIYGGPTFYPVAFSALAALLPGSVTTAAGAMMLALLAVLPLTVAALLTAVAGRTVPAGRARNWVLALAVTGTACFLSTQTMGLLMGLWPHVLAVVCLPPAIASVYALAAIARDRRPAALWHGHRAPILGYMAVILGAVLAHPSNLFTLMLMAGLLVCAEGMVHLSSGRRRRGTVEIGAALALGAVFGLVSHLQLSGMGLTTASAQGVATVVWEVLVDALRVPVLQASLWPVLVVWVLAVLGGVGAVRRMDPVGIAAVLGVVASVVIGVSTQLPGAVFEALSNPWYGARERLAPLMMCLLLLLAAQGLEALIGRVRGTVGAHRPSPMHRMTPARRALPALAAAALLCTVVAALVVPARLPLLGSLAYTAYGVQLTPYVAPDERAFIESAAADLPADAVVIGDPRDGTAAFWPLGGVDTVYPTLARPQTPDSAMLASYLAEAEERPAVCEAVGRLGPTHLYRDTSDASGAAMNAEASWPWRGIEAVPDSWLHPVASDGPYVLYELDVPCPGT